MPSTCLIFEYVVFEGIFRSYYCHLDSSGTDTNLQLYSMEQAAHYWNELMGDMRHYGAARVDRLKERLVFIMNCFGLSLSQLLGQNWPYRRRMNLINPAICLAIF